MDTYRHMVMHDAAQHAHAAFHQLSGPDPRPGRPFLANTSLVDVDHVVIHDVIGLITTA